MEAPDELFTLCSNKNKGTKLRTIMLKPLIDQSRQVRVTFLITISENAALGHMYVPKGKSFMHLHHQVAKGQKLRKEYISTTNV